MVTYEQARGQAQRLLDASQGGPYVITGDQEFDVGWVFFFDSQRHQESGNFLDSLGGNAPILIDRDTGQVCPTGTARPVEEYVAEYAERKRRLREGWPDSLDARFLALLALVRDGMGLRDARHLDLLISAGHRPREGRTALDELIELERRGLVRRCPAAEGGVGYRWIVTDAGSEILNGP
jgi:Immunity protein 35